MQANTLPTAAQSPSPARRALWAAALGWGLDGFDLSLYVYALPGIIASLAISRAAGGLLATETLAASAIGGIVMGALADRIGRKRAMMISIGWYALFTCLCGFAQDYAQLSVLRTLEGLGFGGEWAVGAALACEWVSGERRGRDLGWVQSAWAVGWLGANVAFQLVSVSLHGAAVWRALFFLGILPALAVLYIRREVEDPPIYAETNRLSLRASVERLFGAAMLARTALATLLAIGVQSGSYAVATWMPSYLSAQRHLSSIATGGYLYALIAGSFTGYVTAGTINDVLGRRRGFMLFSLGSALMVPLYLTLLKENWQLIPAGFLLGYFAYGIFSGFGPYFSELFPSGVRASALGFCYNVGRGVAGAAPYLVGLLSAHAAIGASMVAVAVSAYAIAILAALALPETRGVPLDAPSKLA